MPSTRGELHRGGFRRCERIGQPELSELSSGSVAGIVGVALLLELKQTINCNAVMLHILRSITSEAY